MANQDYSSGSLGSLEPTSPLYGDLRPLEVDDKAEAGFSERLKHLQSQLPVGGVIITVKKGNSYDNIFRQVKQHSPSKRVVVYEMEPGREIFSMMIESFKGSALLASFNGDEYVYLTVPHDKVPSAVSAVVQPPVTQSRPSGTYSVPVQNQSFFALESIPAQESGRLGQSSMSLFLPPKEDIRARLTSKNLETSTPFVGSSSYQSIVIPKTNSAAPKKKNSVREKKGMQGSLKTLRSYFSKNKSENTDLTVPEPELEDQEGKLSEKALRELDEAVLPSNMKSTEYITLQEFISCVDPELWHSIHEHLKEKFGDDIQLGVNSARAMKYMRLNLDPRIWNLVGKIATLRSVMRDIEDCGFEAVTLNFECCSGFGSTGFGFFGEMSLNLMFMELIAILVRETQILIIFSDYSLRALLCAWRDCHSNQILNQIGECPFVRVGDFSEKFRLAFDCEQLKESKFVQLRAVGELASTQPVAAVEEVDLELSEPRNSREKTIPEFKELFSFNTPTKRAHQLFDNLEKFEGDGSDLNLNSSDNLDFFDKTQLRRKRHESADRSPTKPRTRSPNFPTPKRLSATSDLTSVGLFESQDTDLDTGTKYGSAIIKCDENTLCYTLHSEYDDEHSIFDLDVLTICNYAESSSKSKSFHKYVQRKRGAAFCSIGQKKGFAGHVQLSFPNKANDGPGGRMLVSAGHWSSLQELQTSKEALIKLVEKDTGDQKEVELWRSQLEGGDEEEQQRVLRHLTRAYIQSLTPGTLFRK